MMSNVDNLGKSERYDGFSKILHWVMAVLIIYATIAGYGMLLVQDDPELFHILSTLNMSGATIATVLFVFRWSWSFFRETPKLPSSISSFQQNVAKLIHSFAYLLMFIVFVSGYLMLKHDYEFFWLFTISQPISNNEVNDFFFIVHRISCVMLGCFIGLHVAAALKHHIILKNDVLKSMTFS
ncbi:cytochrome b [Vibrio campbellii]|nr:cytochrome b/b6 domain-containing protein [Vibrio campbellii]AGU98940.1 cytochrome B561 [Vibrio campbellii ATCC BAA-1116]